MPQQWTALWEMLPGKRQHSSGAWEPPLPLIIGGWWVSSDDEKQSRVKTYLVFCPSRLKSVPSGLTKQPSGGQKSRTFTFVHRPFTSCWPTGQVLGGCGLLSFARARGMDATSIPTATAANIILGAIISAEPSWAFCTPRNYNASPCPLDSNNSRNARTVRSAA